HVTLACRRVRSGSARGAAGSPGALTRKLLSPSWVQLRSHWLVRGTTPSASTLVTLYACWFQIGRAPIQRSAESASTWTPVDAVAACAVRHTLPAGDGPASGSRQAKPSPQSVSAVQRQRPSASPACSRPHSVVSGQSLLSTHCTPSNIRSTA